MHADGVTPDFRERPTLFRPRRSYARVLLIIYCFAFCPTDNFHLHRKVALRKTRARKIAMKWTRMVAWRNIWHIGTMYHISWLNEARYASFLLSAWKECRDIKLHSREVSEGCAVRGGLVIAQLTYRRKCASVLQHVSDCWQMAYTLTPQAGAAK